MNTFELDKAFGTKGEENTVKLLKHFGYSVKWLNEDEDQKLSYDIVYHTGIKLEVKRQTKLKDNCIILELSNASKTTKGWFNRDDNLADEYCFHYGNRFVFIDKKDLEKTYNLLNPYITDYPGQCRICYINLNDIRDLVGVDCIREYEVSAYEINSLKLD